MEIQTSEAEINELLAQASNYGESFNAKVGDFTNGFVAHLSGGSNGLSCIIALRECYQELLGMLSAVQELYTEEIAMGKNAVAAIVEADKTAASNLRQK